MKRAAAVILLYMLCSSAFGQAPLVKEWDKTFGSEQGVGLTFMIETEDYGFLIGGVTSADSGGDVSQMGRGYLDYWILKTDSNANKQWDKRYGGSDDDILTVLKQTKDKGYILGGYSRSVNDGDKTEPRRTDIALCTSYCSDYWVVKVDALGNKQWDKRFGGNKDDALYYLDTTKDGGYILGGFSNSDIGGDKTQGNHDTVYTYQPDYWIVKIDSVGNKEWDKRFGAIGGDNFSSVKQTHDGGYIVGGNSGSIKSGDKSEDSRWGYHDYWLIKIDASGNKEWDKTYGGDNDDFLQSLLQTKDGGYILAGYSSSGMGGDKSKNSRGHFDYWLIKINAHGGKEWDATFGSSSMDLLETFEAIIQTNDNGYLITGNSYSPAGGDKTEDNLGLEQTWIVKIDSTGEKEWDKTILTPGHDEIGRALQSRDGCYVIVTMSDGGIGGYKTEIKWPGYQIWMIKFCDTTQYVANLQLINRDGESVSVFPNPSVDGSQITVNSSMVNAMMEVYDANGRLVFSSKLTAQSSQFDMPLSKGVYFIRIHNEQASVVKRWVRL